MLLRPSLGLAVKAHARYTPSARVLAASVRTRPRPLAHGNAPGSGASSAMATPAQRLHRYRHTPARTPDWAGSRHVYRPRRPTTTPLYPVVQHHLETFLAQATESDPMGYGVPSWVEKDLRDHASRGAPSAAASSPTGLLAYGVTTVATSGCSRSHARRGASARHVIRAAWPRSRPTSPITCCPTFLVRQWVLSLPKRLRPFLEGSPDIAGAVLRIFIRAIRTTLWRTSVPWSSLLRGLATGSPCYLVRLGIQEYAAWIPRQSRYRTVWGARRLRRALDGLLRSPAQPRPAISLTRSSPRTASSSRTRRSASASERGRGGLILMTL